MSILLLSPRVTPDSLALMQAAEAVNQPVMRLSTFRPTDDLHNQRVAVYGEPLFAIIMATSLSHVLIEPTYDWLTTLPGHYTKRWIKQTIMSEARKHPERVFVKNADGMKAFDARVYESGAELPAFYTEDYAVLMAEPVQWDVEFRCFVVDRRIVTHSIYLVRGKLAQTPQGTWIEDAALSTEAHDFCTAFIQDAGVAMPPTCVVDVGIIRGRGWAVIEANPTFASGIYGCDPVGVLAAVNRACIPLADVDEATRHWVHQYEVD